jgi:FkbM family methyltransferase
MPSPVDHLLRLVCHLRPPGAHRLLNALRPLGETAPDQADFHCRFDGLSYAGSLNEHIDREIFFFGAYAADELRFLDRAARAIAPAGGLNFFDIGANVGQHSLWMARRAARVFAFEPSARAVAQLSANIAANQIENVRLFDFALGEEDIEAQLGSGFAHNAGSRSLLWTLDEAKAETVRVRRGADVFDEHDLPAMHLLKLDVEGFEKSVLRGLAGRIARDRPVIMMELIGPENLKSGFSDEAELRRTLYPDHQLFSIDPRRRGLAPFDWNVEEMVCLPVELVDAFARSAAA